jgi:hypothetical protein
MAAHDRVAGLLRVITGIGETVHRVILSQEGSAEHACLIPCMPASARSHGVDPRAMQLEAAQRVR